MKTLKYDEPIKISGHVHWVGTYDPKDSFQCNAYLIDINGKGVLIDPGSIIYFDSLIEKITAVLPLKNLTHVIIQHQDPDVCGNIVSLMKAVRSAGGTCDIFTHERTSFLIRHYGNDLSFIYTNTLPNETLTLDTYSLTFIHTPYLHAPGAIGTYFKNDKVLFSGDLFGGMTETWNLFAGDDYFDQIQTFHKEYMPAKELLLFAMTKFETYDIDIIAPQHGSILASAQASSIIEVFKDFECGLFIDQSFRDELHAARKKIEDQNKIMNEELKLAGQFQRTLLPDRSEISDDLDLDIAFLFRPASQVSGDFLIMEKLDESHLGIMIFDVVGHGVMPGLVTIQIKTLFEDVRKNLKKPSQMLRIINDKLIAISNDEVFLTALYMIYDSKDSIVTIASAGGVPAIHFSGEESDGKTLLLHGTPLGVLEAEKCIIGEISFKIETDDFIIIQTDGLIESFNVKNEPFDRLKKQEKVIKEIKRDKSAQQVLDAVLKAVRQHMGVHAEFTDDITIVVLKKKPAIS